MNAMLPAMIEPEIIEGEFSEAPSRSALISQADSDRHLIELWLGRHASRHTRRNYARHTRRFLAFVAKPLADIRLGDLQAYAVSLEHQAPASRANAVAALKSLFTFAQEAGYLRFNVGAAMKAPPVKNTLAERIMGEMDVLRMLALEPERPPRSGAPAGAGCARSRHQARSRRGRPPALPGAPQSWWRAAARRPGRRATSC